MIQLTITIDYHMCNGCKICYDICPLDVFAWNQEKTAPVVAHPNECWYCGACYYDCPENAIDITLPPIMR